jgi:2-succinyl-5-enolpyruvyl-6-hydroxy-3-cyclohexene-1-carboxylate synthase
VAAQEPPGPVHVNLPFREPLVPDGDLRPGDSPGGAETAEAGSETADACAATVPSPYQRLVTGERRLSAGDLAELADRLARARRPLIVCGPLDEPELPAAVARLAAALDAPILADPLSQLRAGPHDRSRILSRGDLVTRPGAWARAHGPDLVIRLGAPPTSKPTTQLIEASGAEQVVIDGGDGWLDPTLGRTTFVHAGPRGACIDLAFVVPEARAARGDGSGAERGWTDAWLVAERAASGAVRDRLARIDEPSEGRVFDLLADALPPHALLWVGSSMPVRDLDAHFAGGDHTVRVLSNRGANGIDGVVSSALGAAAVHAGPVVLVLGDISFIHDLNALVAARLYALSLTVFVVDNDGGGIFSFLPQARADAPEVGLPDRFEELFGTPHGMGARLGPVVEAFGGRWIDLGDAGRPTTAHDDAGVLRAALDAAIGAPGVTVIRYATERRRNVGLHREVAAAVAAALDRLVVDPPPSEAAR